MADHPQAVTVRGGEPQEYVSIPLLDGGREVASVVLAEFAHLWKTRNC